MPALDTTESGNYGPQPVQLYPVAPPPQEPQIVDRVAYLTAQQEANRIQFNQPDTGAQQQLSFNQDQNGFPSTPFWGDFGPYPSADEGIQPDFNNQGPWDALPQTSPFLADQLAQRRKLAQDQLQQTGIDALDARGYGYPGNDLAHIHYGDPTRESDWLGQGIADMAFPDNGLSRKLAQQKLNASLGPTGLALLNTITRVPSAEKAGYYSGNQIALRPGKGTEDSSVLLAHELTHAYEDRYMTPEDTQKFYETAMKLVAAKDPTALRVISRLALDTSGAEGLNTYNLSDPAHVITAFVEDAFRNPGALPDALKPFLKGLFSEKFLSKAPNRIGFNDAATAPTEQLDLSQPERPFTPSTASREEQGRALTTPRGQQGLGNLIGTAIGSAQQGLAQQLQFNAARKNPPQSAEAVGFLSRGDRQGFALWQAANAPNAAQEDVQRYIEYTNTLKNPDVINIGDRAKTAFDIATTEIPGAARVASVAGDIAGGLAKASPQLGLANAIAEHAPLTDVFGKDLTPANAVSTAVETLIPQEVWQAALELVPGVGNVPTLVKAVREGAPEAVSAVLSAGEKLGAREDVQKALTKLSEESGFAKIPGEGEAERLGLGPPSPEGQPVDIAAPVLPEKGSLAYRIDQLPTTADEAALQVSEWLRKGAKARPEQEIMFAKQRAEQAARMEAVFQRGGSYVEAKAAGAGGFKRPTLKPLDITPEVEGVIRDEIRTASVFGHPGERISANEALDAMMRGHLPEPNEAIQLGKILGKPFVEQIGKRGGIQYGRILTEVANAPRALMTMGDLSAAGRQAIIVAPRHPILFGKALGTQIRALKSQAVADALVDEIVTHPDFGLLEGRVQLLGHGMHEEAYQAPFLSHIPGVGQIYDAAERAFSAMTNKIRWDYAYDTIKNWRKQGVPLDAGHLDNLANYVNNLTGRGKLPKYLENHSATLNAIFFAPKFVASRAQLIGDLLRPSQSAAVRLMAAQDLGAFVATGVGTLAALKYIGGVNVNTDPRSSDFGKYTFLGQHHDFWAGFGPIARLVAQEGYGQRVTSAGEVTSRDWTGAFTQFLRTKLAPIPGLGVDIHQGADLGGNEVDRASFQHFDRQNPLMKMIAPLFIQDTIDAYRQGGIKGAALAAPGALLGEGVTSYPASAAAEKSASKSVASEQLQKAGFPDPDTTFKAVSDSFKSLGIDPSQYKSVTEYKAAYVDKYGPAIAASDHVSLAEGASRAGAFFEKQPPVQSYRKGMAGAELYFWKQHPDLLDQEVQAGRIKPPTKAQQAILDVYRRSHPVP